MKKTMVICGHYFTENKNLKNDYIRHGYCIGYTLRDFYNTYSYNKEKAYEDCLRLQHDLHGVDGGVQGANSCFFTYGFITRIDENGNFKADGRPIYCKITHANNYFMYL